VAERVVTDEEQGLRKNFEEAGFKPVVKPLAEFQEGYGLEGDDEEDEEDEDDEEEGSDAADDDEMEE
jgi:hypothetical protein